MVQETLQINIKADNKSGIVGVQQTIQSLDKLDLSAKKAGAAVANSGAAIKKSSGSYVELSRVIQDLPFGFTAISNNLTQLIPGVGALGLAFSAVVSAVTFAQVGFRAWGGSAKAAKEEVDKLNTSIAKEITDFRLLYTVATNANVPLEARKQAVRDLRDQYGAYLKDFSDEAIMAGKAAGAYQQLSGAIIQAAKARAAQEKIQQLATQRLQKEAELAKIAADAQKKAADNAARRAQRGDISLREQEMTGGIESAATTFAKASNAALKVVDAISAIDKEMLSLENTVINNTVKPFEVYKDRADKAVQSTNEFATTLNRLRERLKDTKSLGLQDFLPIERQQIGSTDKIKQGEVGFSAAELGFQDSTQAAEAYKNELQQIFQLSNQLGQSFVNTIASGQSLGQALVNVFADIAKAITAAIAKAAIFKLLTSVLNPGGAGLGAAFSFKDLFKGFLGIGKLPFMADGGVVNKPTLGVFGEAGSEAIMPLNKLNSMLMTASQLGGGGMANMEIMTKVSGQDLLLWIQRAGYSRNLQR